MLSSIIKQAPRIISRNMSTAGKSTSALQATKLFNLDGKVAVVTGGGTGIGLMISQALAANGAKVYITGRREDALKQAVEAHSPTEGSGSLIPIPGTDIRNKESIQQLVDQISSKEKQLDILVNNSGISGPTSDVALSEKSADALKDELWKEGFEEWQDVFATNCTGYYFMSVGFLPLLAAATKATPKFSGCIINISSISGILASPQHHFAYNSSKAAIIQLNQMLGKIFSGPGVKVRVNSIAPGIFPSEMTADDSNDQQKSHIEADGDKFRKEKGINAGRPGRDEDMAQAALMLACNQYMVGQTVVVDGGYLMGNP